LGQLTHKKREKSGSRQTKRRNKTCSQRSDNNNCKKKKMFSRGAMVRDKNPPNMCQSPVYLINGKIGYKNYEKLSHKSLSRRQLYLFMAVIVHRGKNKNTEKSGGTRLIDLQLDLS